MFLFCRPVSDKRRFSPHRELRGNFTFTVFENASRVPAKEWSKVLKGRDIFLELDFLKKLEACEGLSPRYVIVYEKKVACGIIYYQVVDFKAGVLEGLIRERSTDKKKLDSNIFGKYINANREQVLMRMLTCGNNLLSGQHAFRFDERFKDAEVTALVLSVSDAIGREEKLSRAVSALIIKDFEDPLKETELLEKEKYIRFKVDPDMKLDIPENVRSLEEYTSLFSKKYRNRSKAILKAGASLEVRELSLNEIEKNDDRLHALYTQVYDRSSFKLLVLPGDYFSSLKKLFGDKFRIAGIFRENVLVGFASNFLKENDVLEAHFIGLDYQFNKELELYQNILYINLKMAIASSCRSLDFGRTAAEIKSTIGARAIDLYCYAKAQNTVTKLVIKPLLNFLQPEEWTPRNPFKEKAVENAK